ncbi:MAG: hypothetical protein LUE29_06820 [Lachnospiraceae bacterium]|nr:hypothetical protein [Lachnospiraceae bacterium]
MKKMKIRGKKLMAVILTLAVCWQPGLSMQLFASTVSEPVVSGIIDPDLTGSIAVTMHESDGTAVGGGRLALYPVATLEADQEAGEYNYVYTQSFEGLDAAYLDGTAYVSMAAAAAQVVAEQNPAPLREAQIGADGTAEFTELSIGLYLIVQTEAAAGYEKANAFLVTIPMESDSGYIYDVDASPKVEVAAVETETPGETETPTEPETTPEEETTPEGETPTEPVTTPEGETPTEPVTTPEGETSTEPVTTPEDETTVPTRLPQTGAVLWPLSLCGMLGLILAAAGYYMVRSDKRKNNGPEA